MFGMGGTELLVVLLIALVLFGPNKLPEIARQIGKAMGEFRRVADDTVGALMDEPRAKPSKTSVERGSAQDEDDI